MPIGVLIERAVGLPSFESCARNLLNQCGPDAVILDVGCGSSSSLRALCGDRSLIGVDTHAPAIADAARRGTHDELFQLDLMDDGRKLEECLAGRPLELIVLSHVIEHLPKRVGFEILERLESFTLKFVLLDTPNGFLPQGPEYGNESQRHLSGWFPDEFRGMAYEVVGTGGVKWLRGYAGVPRWRFKGGPTAETVLAASLRIWSRTRFSANLTAWKDVRGEPPRLSGARKPSAEHA